MLAALTYLEIDPACVKNRGNKRLRLCVGVWERTRHPPILPRPPSPFNTANDVRRASQALGPHVVRAESVARRSLPAATSTCSCRCNCNSHHSCIRCSAWPSLPPPLPLVHCDHRSVSSH